MERFSRGTASGANLTDQFISTNQYGYDIDQDTVYGLQRKYQQKQHLLAEPAECDRCRGRPCLLG